MKYIGVMGLPGGSEIILIIFIILLYLVQKKLPDLARSMGKSLGEFKKGQQESESPDEKISEIQDSYVSEDNDSESHDN